MTEEFVERIRDLELQRDALQSSIASLQVLVENERAQKRVVKRKLVAVEKAREDDDDVREELRVAREDVLRCRERIEELEKSDESEELKGKVHGLSKELEEVKVERDCELREKEEKIGALQTMVAEVPELKARVRELEGELRANVDVGDVGEEGEINRRLLELKIARNVIAEKDKLVKEMRVGVKEAESRELEAELKCRVAEARIKALEEEGEDVRDRMIVVEEELEGERRDREEMEKKVSEAGRREEEAEKRAKEEQKKAEEAEKKVEEAESRVEAANSRAEEAETRAREVGKRADEAEWGARDETDWERQLEAKEELLQEAATEHEEYRACVQERLEIAEDQRSEAMVEAAKLKRSLEAAEKEVTRLGELVRKRASAAEMTGVTSPQSLDASSEGPTISCVSDCESFDRINELEESARLARSSYEQKCLEAQTLASSVEENASTIVTLNRALLVSRKACDDKHGQLEESMGKANSLDKTVRKLKTELAAKVRECATLEKRIMDDLEPSLRKVNGALEKRGNELKTLTAQFGMYREQAEETQEALERQVEDLSGRLQGTLEVLSETQKRLTNSEERGAELEERIAVLEREKEENLQNIEDLMEDCEHRRQSLVLLQARLVQVEQTIARHEQTACDANQSKERLTRFLAQAYDRQAVAEQRAERKDGLMVQLESRAKELERNHRSMRDHLDDKLLLVEELEQELGELRNVVQMKQDALENQAKLANQREEQFEVLACELRSVIEDCESNLKTAHYELQTAGRRVGSLSETLSATNEKLETTESALAETERELADARAETKRAEARLNDSHEEYARLKAEYESAQEELVARDRQIASNLLSITEKGGLLAGLRAEKSELENAIVEMQKELATELARGEQLASQVKTLEQAVSSVSADLSTCEEELSMRSTEAESLNRSLTSMQGDVARLENRVAESEEELTMNVGEKKSLEIELERATHQLEVLEAHLDGHGSLLKECRDKEESLALKCAELEQAEEHVSQMKIEVADLDDRLVARVEELNKVNGYVTSLEKSKSDLEKELERAMDARTQAESSLNVTSANLAMLEKSTTEEIQDLKATVLSLTKALDEKESTLSCTSETLSQTSVQSKLTKEQLIDSRTRGDRLFAQLTAAEYELASKKESLTVTETKLVELQKKLKSRDDEIERLERNLLDRSQALTCARSRVEELTAKSGNIVRGEVLALQTKLGAKEKAIANLHNWCCFINGKLHVAEKALSAREVDLEVSSTAFKRLELQVQTLNDVIAEKESNIREVESSRAVEHSELRSRIQSLQEQVEQANAEAAEAKALAHPDAGYTEDSVVALTNELRDCKDMVRARDVEVSQIQARSKCLQDTVKTYERELSAAKRTVESVTLDLEKLRVEAYSKQNAMRASDKQATVEVSKVRSETGYLLVELRKTEAELAAANENAKTWQARVDELQPLAEATLETQRALEMVSARLALTEKDSKQRIDLLEIRLDEARRERDVAERDCSAALADYAEMRARLTDGYARQSLPASLGSSIGKSMVTFVLDCGDAVGLNTSVYILGGDPALGEWDPARRIPLRVIERGRNAVTRECDVPLPAEVVTSYKFVADGLDGSLIWEGGENRQLKLHGELQLKARSTWRK